MSASGSQLDVTVVVAAYNAEHSIADAVQSALDQSGVRLEVLVVDDGSTDATAQVVDRLAHTEPRLRLIRSASQGGPGAARNLALDQAQADWVAILDADDKFQAGRLSALLAIAREWNADMAADNLWLVDETSRQAFDLMLSPENIAAPTVIAADAFVRNNQPLNIKRKYGLLKPIIRRDLIDRYAIRYDADTPYGEDILFYLECLAHGATLVLIPQAYYFYRLSRAQMTRTTSVSQAEAFLERCTDLLQREDIKAIPGLADAVSDWCEQLRSNLVYLRFKTALGQRRPIAALGVLTARPDLLSYIAAHIRRSASLRCRQWVASRVSR